MEIAIWLHINCACRGGYIANTASAIQNGKWEGRLQQPRHVTVRQNGVQAIISGIRAKGDLPSQQSFCHVNISTIF